MHLSIEQSTCATHNERYKRNIISQKHTKYQRKNTKQTLQQLTTTSHRTTTGNRAVRDPRQPRGYRTSGSLSLSTPRIDLIDSSHLTLVDHLCTTHCYSGRDAALQLKILSHDRRSSNYRSPARLLLSTASLQLIASAFAKQSHGPKTGAKDTTDQSRPTIRAPKLYFKRLAASSSK